MRVVTSFVVCFALLGVISSGDCYAVGGAKFENTPKLRKKVPGSPKVKQRAYKKAHTPRKQKLVKVKRKPDAAPYSPMKSQRVGVAKRHP